MKRNKRLTILFVLGILLIPSAARADGMSVIMFGSFAYILIGNFFIGILEGTLISKVFKCRTWNTIKWMIAANYLSAWVGLISMDRLGILDKDELSIWVILITYCGTIILEYPFCYLALRDKNPDRPKLPKQALLASILAQTVSYSLLLLCYYSVIFFYLAPVLGK